jgi:hypothetical protein
MSFRLSAAATLDDNLTVGDLRRLIDFAERFGLTDETPVVVNCNPDYPYEAYDIEVTANGA